MLKKKDFEDYKKQVELALKAENMAILTNNAILNMIEYELTNYPEDTKANTE